MNNDPIVTEVRDIRDKLARGSNYDLHAIFAGLRASESVDDPAHPLVKDASEWSGNTEVETLALKEKPRTEK